MGYEIGVFPRIDAVAASAEVGEPWEAATSPEAAYMYRTRAAMNLDIYQPYTAEQGALNNYLAMRQAGLRLCDYAWRLFVHSRHSPVERSASAAISPSNR